MALFIERDERALLDHGSDDGLFFSLTAVAPMDVIWFCQGCDLRNPCLKGFVCGCHQVFLNLENYGP
jgi:hypothetical protein